MAIADNQSTLCHAALDASVSDVKRLCAGYRWQGDSNAEDEKERALQQWDSRSLTWAETSNGGTRIQLILPPDRAQVFLNSVQHSLSQYKKSFNIVRTLSPECYCFHVVDTQGQNIHNRSDADISDGGTRSTFGSDESTRVYCVEPVPDYCYRGIRDRHSPSFITEAPARYATIARCIANTLHH